MRKMERNYQLNRLIEEEAWDTLFSINPTVVASYLSFKDIIRLVNRLYTLNGDDAAPEYSRRLLYTLKRLQSKEWNSHWEFERLLAFVCANAYRYGEEYYAYRRAIQLISPIPANLAYEFLCSLGKPNAPLISLEEATMLCDHVLQKYPCAGVLKTLIRYYGHFSNRNEELDRLNQLKDSLEDTWPNLPPFSVPYAEESFEFNSPNSSIEITVKQASISEIHLWMKSKSWSHFYNVDPRYIVDILCFKDCLRLAYRLILDNPASTEYAIHLLYALRIDSFDIWSADWHNEALLGYTCELAGNWDEQLGAYDQAAFFGPDTIPANLAIATARCCFAPDLPSISFEKAIQLLQDALKEELYLDALELLLQIYLHLGQDNKVAEIKHMLSDMRETQIQSSSILPACVTQEFVAIDY